MPLFQKSVVKKHLAMLNKKTLNEKWKIFASHFLNPQIQDNIKLMKEEQYQDGFLNDLFVNVLGYLKSPSPGFNLISEQKNYTDSRKADGAIIINEKTIAVIELKGTSTSDFTKAEEQAFSYKHNQKGCVYVIVSNFEKLRFFIDDRTEFIEFNLFALKQEEFPLLYLSLSFESLSKDLPKKIKNDSLSQETVITKSLYDDYTLFKQELFENATKHNPHIEVILLYKKIQKLLDRFLFLLFAEDRQLLAPNSVRKILSQWKQLKELDEYVPLYERFKKFFGYLNTGFKSSSMNVFAYNGGLFFDDDILDNLVLEDELLYKHTSKMSDYDFQSEVDVNILGHIFENSLNDIEEIKARLEGKEVDKSSSKRKKDGIYYTARFVTKFIIENTAGKLCQEKKIEIGLQEEDYIRENKKKKIVKELIARLKEYRDWLLNLTILDPACGSGAFLNEALNFLIQEHRYIDELENKLLGGELEYQNVENSILENNLFGVDINEESVEIAKLSLWLRSAKPLRKLNDLSNNLKCGNSLVDNVEIAGDKAFDWQKEFPKVFERGGFDIVIGNPPYIQLCIDGGRLAKMFEGLGFKTFARTGDIYVLFYEKGTQLLKENGLLAFISSNKWMRAGYGEKLREFFAGLEPYILIDLGPGVFESATVDTNILFLKKSKATKEHNLRAVTVKATSDEKQNFAYILEKEGTTLKKLTKDAWAILSDAEMKLKEKIERIGTPLKDWNINIYRGILTGFNKAFIIDGKKKDELIAEDPRSAEIIKPILRGRDIKRYKAEFADLHIITTFPALKLDIEKYSAIKKYFESFGKRLLQIGEKGTRKKTGNKWFETQDQITYYEEFEKEKIVWNRIADSINFCFADRSSFVLDSTFFLSNCPVYYFLCVLNTKLIKYWIKNNAASLGEGVYGAKIYIENLPIPRISEEAQQPFVEKVNEILAIKEVGGDSSSIEREIDQMVYALYDLTAEEIAIVNC